MRPQTIIPETEYVAAFTLYVRNLAEKWLGSSLEWENPPSILSAIEREAPSNHRVTYLKYLLPLVDPSYAGSLPSGFRLSMRKVLYNMRRNGLPYNDYLLLRLCDILLKDADLAELVTSPLPEDYKDLQKLLWTFAQAFRKKVRKRYSGQEEII
ncbi:hypothetical protein [Cohnella zeiphila]|uniref:Uncharacterized protein n=1 Tax=Cohnella zeiphila TaxID=2761120 RepID=A0A7X0VVV1_9BACL|nr:hypothetical protein [Cohnella zeiphila]MBB6731830.1 hypothetical protein [Cohnella zeiphila]